MAILLGLKSSLIKPFEGEAFFFSAMRLYTEFFVLDSALEKDRTLGADFASDSSSQIDQDTVQDNNFSSSDDLDIDDEIPF